MAEKITPKQYQLPKAMPGQYKGLAAQCTLQPVTDGQVELAIDTLRLRAAVPQEISGPATRGDDVVLDFEGFDGAGMPIPDSRMEQVHVHLGRGQMLPGVEDKICGHCAGETFLLDFTYPANFRVAALAGSKATFHITLHSVERRTKPLLDDTFAKTQGYETVKALKAGVRSEKVAMHERMARNAVKNTLLDQAAENLVVAIPAGILDDLEEERLQGLAAELTRRGSNLAEYLRLSHQTEEGVRSEMRAAAEKGLRRRMAVEAIAQKEKLDISEQECSAEYDRLAKLDNTTPEHLRKTLTKAMVRGALLTEKVGTLLAQTASITLKQQEKEE